MKKLEDIIERHPEAWKSFIGGDEIVYGSDLYYDLYEYFLESGDMPYGVAKARTGDPLQWIMDELAKRYCP